MAYIYSMPAYNYPMPWNNYYNYQTPITKPSDNDTNANTLDELSIAGDGSSSKPGDNEADTTKPEPGDNDVDATKPVHNYLINPQVQSHSITTS